MKLFFLFLTSVYTLTACTGNNVTNIHNKDLEFFNIQTDFKVQDVNNYDCEKIDIATLNHIFSTAKITTHRDIHDSYSIVGCSINGKVMINKNIQEFSFDYGGTIYFKSGEVMACGKYCCRDGFKYCTWEKEVKEESVSQD